MYMYVHVVVHVHVSRACTCKSCMYMYMHYGTKYFRSPSLNLEVIQNYEYNHYQQTCLPQKIVTYPGLQPGFSKGLLHDAPYLPKIFQIEKIHILIHVFSAWPSFSAKRQ